MDNNHIENILQEGDDVPVPGENEDNLEEEMSDYDKLAAVLIEEAESGAPSFRHGVGLTALPSSNLKDNLGFSYAEHSFLGDSLNLYFDKEKTPQLAKSYTFTLPNKVRVTYGQINALAGDLYGTYEPISDGKDLEDKCIRFIKAYETLAGDNGFQPEDANNLIKIMQKEVDVVHDALQRHVDPSFAYSQIDSIAMDATLTWATFWRGWLPSYMNLARINFDHFGTDARAAYNAGHLKALQKAKSGDLLTAYTMNAFADHFLEDCFAAGHLRVPRRMLHGETRFLKDKCAQYMHDEDNAIGLDVKSPSGVAWRCYGDNRCLDVANDINKQQCLKALQASVDEIFSTWMTKTIPAESDFQAWQHAPTTESINGPQELQPLFRSNGDMRKPLEDRWSTHSTRWYTYETAWISLCTSGMFGFPITMDGPNVIAPNTSLVAVSGGAPGQDRRVYFVDTKGRVRELKNEGGKWSGGDKKSVICSLRKNSPLGAVAYYKGQDIRLYGVKNSGNIYQMCFSAWKSAEWYEGSMCKAIAQVAPKTTVATWFWEETGKSRCVFQEPSNKIAVWEHNPTEWQKIYEIPDVCQGSGIAITGWTDNAGVLQHRIFYQDTSGTLRMYRYPDKLGWALDAGFNFGKAPKGTSLAAVCWYKPTSSTDTNASHLVYWQDYDGRILETKQVNGTWGPAKRITDPIVTDRDLGDGTSEIYRTKLSAVQFADGQSIRLYHQVASNRIVERRCDAGVWIEGGPLPA